MAEKLHNLSEKLPDDDGSPGHPPGASAQPPTPPPPDTPDFGHGPVTGSAQITAMNVADARQAIQLLRSALDDAGVAHNHCRILTRILGPGQEPASDGYANSANTNGQRYQDASLRLQANIKAEMDKLQAAIDQVTGTEESNKDQFGKLA